MARLEAWAMGFDLRELVSGGDEAACEMVFEPLDVVWRHAEPELGAAPEDIVGGLRHSLRTSQSASWPVKPAPNLGPRPSGDAIPLRME